MGYSLKRRVEMLKGFTVSQYSNLILEGVINILNILRVDWVGEG
jgi:hypothetical protein